MPMHCGVAYESVRSTLGQSCSYIEPSLAFATGTTSKHQRIMWPGLYRKLTECLCIVVWHMRVSFSFARGHVITVCVHSLDRGHVIRVWLLPLPIDYLWLVPCFFHTPTLTMSTLSNVQHNEKFILEQLSYKNSKQLLRDTLQVEAITIVSILQPWHLCSTMYSNFVCNFHHDVQMQLIIYSLVAEERGE